MATPLAPFYNQADQDIYEEGEHFIPQEYYRLNKFNNTVAPVPPEITQQTTQGSGIPYTNAFTNAGGSGGGTGFGQWGNLDEGSAKQFNIDGNIVTGYKNLGTGLYQDYAGLNIQNLGIQAKPVLASLLNLDSDDGEDPTYPGLFNKVSLKAIRKNPGIVKQFFARQDVKKQTELQNEINAANFDAMQEAELGRNIAEYGTTGGVESNRPNTGLNKPGDKKGQSPTGGDVAGTPFADGGRIGYKKGGRQDQMGGTMEQTAQELREAAPDQFAGGMNISHGGGDGPTITGGDNIVIPPRDNFTVDTDFISKEPSIDATYSPAEWANIRARIFNKDITSEDDINFALSGEMGPFRADLDTSKDLRNISFNKDLGNFNLSGNTDLENYNLGIDYNRGPFFAGATTDNMGNTNFNVGAKWSWGGEPENYNTLSYQDQNPDLIYGQNLRYGGLASIL